jgi:hypothetical protein
MALYDQSMLAGYKICKISFAKHSPNCYAFALYLARGICLMIFCHGFTDYKFQIAFQMLAKYLQNLSSNKKRAEYGHERDKYTLVQILV